MSARHPRPRCPACEAPPPAGHGSCPQHHLFCVDPHELGHRSHAPLLGRTLAERYVLTGWLGGGGATTVYRAIDTVEGGPVAVKVVDQDRLVSAATRILFERTARSLKELGHPAVVRVRDVGAVAGGLLRGTGYVVMDRLSGLSLADRLALGPMSQAEARPLFAVVADALCAAHRVGVVHGDLRPAQVRFVGGADASAVRLVGFDLTPPPDRTAEGDLAALEALRVQVMGSPEPPPAVVPAPAPSVAPDAPPRQWGLVPWLVAALVLAVGGLVWALTSGGSEPEAAPDPDDVVRITIPTAPQ